jgi:diguanylate cyclase (GGDEF)-like protein
VEVGSTGAGRPWRVLVVEDSRTDAELIEGLLAHRDDVRFNLTLAETLAGALAWLAGHTPDVILLDLTLPDSDRLNTYRAVRNRAPSVPVVVMTGSAERGLGQEAVQQGAQDFMIKGPMTSDRLAERLLFAVERVRRAERLSLRDPLTGLPTALLLTERVEEALGRAEREKRYVAMLALGLGDFGSVDARFGPMAGDELLFGVSERLAETFPPPAGLARVGVDEFAVMLEGLARPSNAERAAHRLLGALAPEFKLGVDKLRVTAHIGIALARQVPEALILLDRARRAMIAQRRSGDQGTRQG